MADRLEAMLEPGETVLYRARTPTWKLLSELLVALAMLAIAFLALYAVLNWLWPGKSWDFGYYFAIAMGTYTKGH